MRPRFKKSILDTVVPTNYHPISNPLLLSKVIERVVADQLPIYLDDISILDPFQSGFQLGYETKTAWSPLQMILGDIWTKVGRCC